MLGTKKKYKIKHEVCFKADSLRWYYPDQVKGFVLSHFIWIKVAPLTIINLLTFFEKNKYVFTFFYNTLILSLH